jgi:hypothetical protein
MCFQKLLLTLAPSDIRISSQIELQPNEFGTPGLVIILQPVGIDSPGEVIDGPQHDVLEQALFDGGIHR